MKCRLMLGMIIDHFRMIVNFFRRDCSDSLAIRSWGHRAFSSTAKYLDVSFLGYSEWLDYEEKQACIETFNQFIWNTEITLNYTRCMIK